MMGPFGGVVMVAGMALWAVIVGMALWALYSLTGARPVNVEDSALDILQRRYARGEISRAEFELARRDLDRGIR
jgi:putative membrane protein